MSESDLDPQVPRTQYGRGIGEEVVGVVEKQMVISQGGPKVSLDMTMMSLGTRGPVLSSSLLLLPAPYGSGRRST